MILAKQSFLCYHLRSYLRSHCSVASLPVQGSRKHQLASCSCIVHRIISCRIVLVGYTLSDVHSVSSPKCCKYRQNVVGYLADLDMCLVVSLDQLTAICVRLDTDINSQCCPLAGGVPSKKEPACTLPLKSLICGSAAYNFDHPDAFDRKLLRNCLLDLRVSILRLSSLGSNS